MARLTSRSCDFCQADSFEWYQSVCEGYGQSYCRTCGSAWPSHSDECGGPEDRENVDPPASRG